MEEIYHIGKKYTTYGRNIPHTEEIYHIGKKYTIKGRNTLLIYIIDSEYCIFVRIIEHQKRLLITYAKNRSNLLSCIVLFS